VQINPVNGDLIRQATPAFLVPTKEYKGEIKKVVANP
jgi:predicted transcriptional regulator